MTPQTHVMYAATLREGAAPEVRQLLQTMNVRPGVYNPGNTLLPLHRLQRVHFARILVVTDLAAADRAVYGLPVGGLPDYLVFLAEVDGEEPSFREQLVRTASSGLRGLFSHCETFESDVTLENWLKRAHVSANAAYTNWLGRTVVQVREEEVCAEHCRRYFAMVADQGQTSKVHGRWQPPCEKTSCDNRQQACLLLHHLNRPRSCGTFVMLCTWLAFPSCYYYSCLSYSSRCLSSCCSSDIGNALTLP